MDEARLKVTRTTFVGKREIKGDKAEGNEGSKR